MAFPTSPVDGQKASVNGITYIYNSAIPAWTVNSTFLESFSGNLLIANNISTANSITADELSVGPISATDVTVTGNVSGGNLTTAGDVTTATVTASTTITATGNVSGGNLTTGGNVEANFFFGNASQLTGIAISSTELVDSQRLDIRNSSGNIVLTIFGAGS